MCVVKNDRSAVLARDPNPEKSLAPSSPRMRCLYCRWSLRTDDAEKCSTMAGHS
jgi:hypothetical protein